MGADNAKDLLIDYNHKKYTNFTLNDDSDLILPAVSSVPWIGASGRCDIYKKESFPPKGSSQVCFISKNEKPHAVLWKTSPDKLKSAVRWGIVRTESITGKVISSLGKYRVSAHERIAKGMMSNTQDLKLRLVDLYQDRFEALQALESLANTNCTKDQYQFVLESYIVQLEVISRQLEARFNDSILNQLNTGAIDQLKKDLAADISRAKAYLQSLEEKDSLKSNNRARGVDSILEFVKRQMTYNLYELQGINQDLTYSNKRWFALTRGELNDYIEDARKEIDDHQADLRNAVTAKHHGLYSPDPEAKVCYDFSADDLTSERERQVLLAISFIEGWDKVENSHSAIPGITNGEYSEELSLITATNWQRHRNFITFLKSTAYFLLNTIKSVILPTHPWEEESWTNKNFHLYAKTLRDKAKPNNPLWFKPYYFLSSIAYAVIDIFKGIRTVGSQLIVKMPADIINDWNSSKKLLTYPQVIEQAEKEMAKIKDTEEARLKELLWDTIETSAPTSLLARSEYHLSAGEANDILTATIRGLNGFSSFFTHEIYAKDPVAGLLFTAAYAVGGAAIFAPTLSTAVLGSTYVAWFSNASYAMGSTPLAAAIAGGSSQAQITAAFWDLLMRGPNSTGANAVKQVLQDPLTIGAYIGAAYGLGYILANGIGHPIPWLSDTLKEDSGSVPETNYPILGGKLAIIAYELLASHGTHPYHPVEISYNGKELDAYPHIELTKDDKKIIARMATIFWLSQNASTLPKLNSNTLFNIAQQIDDLFPPEDAVSLKKILYPEKERSIAYQLFAIPFTYIPALLRLATAVIMSGVAWLVDNPKPFQPIKHASTALNHKITKDLSRLIVAGAGAVHLISNFASSLVKALAFTISMTIGRIAGLINWHPAHALHKGIAKVHVFFNTLGEFLYPVRAVKKVESAHFNHTFRATDDFYRRLLLKLSDQHEDLNKHIPGDEFGEGAFGFPIKFQSGKVERDESDDEIIGTTFSR